MDFEGCVAREIFARSEKTVTAQRRRGTTSSTLARCAFFFFFCLTFSASHIERRAALFPICTVAFFFRRKRDQLCHQFVLFHVPRSEFANVITTSLHIHCPAGVRRTLSCPVRKACCVSALLLFVIELLLRLAASPPHTQDLGRRGTHRIL